MRRATPGMLVCTNPSVRRSIPQYHVSTLWCRRQRASRLLLASYLVYIWVVYLGVCAKELQSERRLRRQDCYDLSLFRLGLRVLARSLKDTIPLPDGILVES